MYFYVAYMCCRKRDSPGWNWTSRARYEVI